MAWLTQRQYLRVLTKFSAARLELKHSAVLNAFVVRQSPGHHSVLPPKPPTSREATDGVAITGPVPNGTNQALNRGVRIEALFSASYLRRKVQNKAPQRATREVAVTSPPGLSSRLTAELRI